MRLTEKNGQYVVDQIGLDQPLIFPGTMDKQTVARAVMQKYGDQIRANEERKRLMGEPLPPEKRFLLGMGQTGEMFKDFLTRPRFGWGPEFEASQAEYDARAADRRMVTNRLDQYGDSFSYGQMTPYFAPPVGAASKPIAGLMSRLGVNRIPGLGGASEAVGRSIIADAAGQGAVLGAASDDGTAVEGAAYAGAGGFLGKALSHALRPVDRFAQDPHLAAMADRGERLGYTLLPSQRTGSKALESFEDILENNWFSGGGALKVAEMNQANTNRIVAEALGFRDKTYTKVTGEMLDRVSQRFSEGFNRATSGSAIRLGDEFIDVLAELERSNMGWVRNKDLKKVINRAFEDAASNGGWISGEQYQRISSELVADIRANYKMGGNVRYGQKIQTLKEALDDAAEFSLPPERVQQFKDLRSDYRTYAMLMKNSTINEDTGDVSLRALRQTLRRDDKRGYRELKNRSDLYDATRFEGAFPGYGMNSRTSARQSIPATMASSGILGMLGYDAYGDDPGAGVAAAIALPASLGIMGRYYNSPLGRRHFGKGLLPPISDEFRRYLGQKVGLGAVAATQAQ